MWCDGRNGVLQRRRADRKRVWHPQGSLRQAATIAIMLPVVTGRSNHYSVSIELAALERRGVGAWCWQSFGWTWEARGASSMLKHTICYPPCSCFKYTALTSRRVRSCTWASSASALRLASSGNDAMRVWKSASDHELRASLVRLSSAYGYCGYCERDGVKRKPHWRASRDR